MTTVIRRRSAAATLAVVLGLVLSSCSSGPSQVNSAAIVDGRTIGVGQVQELVDRAVKAEPAAKALADQHKLGELSRAVLSQLVLHELIVSYTARTPVALDPAEVAELTAQLGAGSEPLPADGSVSPEQIVSASVSKVLAPDVQARDFLTLAAIGGRELNSLQVTFDYAGITPNPDDATGSVRDLALAKAKQLAVGLDRATAVQKEDTDSGALQWRTTTGTPADLGADFQNSALVGAPVNSVVAFQPSADTATWIIALIRKRETITPAAGAQAPSPQVAIALGQRVLQSEVDKTGVTISPRYGVYDQVAMRVAASEAESTGVYVPVKVDAKP